MKIEKDSYRHKGLRKILINSLREKGITDEVVLEAMNEVPRHRFLDTVFDNIAYEDRAFNIGSGQTISQPYTVAYQTQLLRVKPNDKILEIGTGSAYQASVLAEMGAQVFTIERHKNLFTNKDLYALQKYPQIKFFYGDGFEGLPTYAPFDKVIITCAAPFIPPKLVVQMKPGGIMILPLNEYDSQRMIRVTKESDGSISEEHFDKFSFVPMLSGKSK
ncbi:MAG: protein-L-isoaspartate(D-aspartate) O-methyltransferase [Ferruginibacter sp.]|nr:protein-L-isoaspartate(D-aspartate) O-methyltransferase [Ferruginibacter sp.]